MRTVVVALGRGSATVSGGTLARSGSSGRRVVTEAIGLSKTPRKSIDRTVIIRGEKRAGPERLAIRAALRHENAGETARTLLTSRSRFSASKSTHSRRCRRDCAWRSIPALFEPSPDRPPEPEDRPAAAVRSFVEPVVQWCFPLPG